MATKDEGADREGGSPSETAGDHSSDAGDGSGDDVNPGWERLLGVVVVLAVAVSGVFLAFEIWPDQVPQRRDPGWLDSIFASKSVLFATRAVLFCVAIVVSFGAVYTVVSIVKRMRSGHWLRRVGPFEVSEEAVSDLKQAYEAQRELAESAQEEIVQLKENLAETQELAEHFYELWSDLLEEEEVGVEEGGETR